MRSTGTYSTDTWGTPQPWLRQATYLIVFLVCLGGMLALTVIGCFLLSPWVFAALAVLLGGVNGIYDYRSKRQALSLKEGTTLR